MKENIFPKVISLWLILFLAIPNLTWGQNEILESETERRYPDARQEKYFPDQNPKITYHLDPERMEIISDIPEGTELEKIKTGANPQRPNLTAKQVAEICRKEGWEVRAYNLKLPHVETDRQLRRIMGWLEPGQPVLVKVESKDGYEDHKVMMVLQCGNDVVNLTTIRIFPGGKTIVKIYNNIREITVTKKSVVTRNYVRIEKKTSKWPWIVAAALGAGLIACFATRNHHHRRPAQESDTCDPDGSPADR